MDSNFVFFLILAIILLCVCLHYYHKYFKVLKTGCVTLVNGAVKSGKSHLLTYLAIKDFKRRHFKWFIGTKIFNLKIEEPLFYTNCSVSFGELTSKKRHPLDRCIMHVDLEHLLRLKRLNYGSVMLLYEASLLNDAQDYKNEVRNTLLSLFYKLYGHETRGGSLYLDTQSISDLHYSAKRVLSSSIFIERSKDFLFWRVMYVRELIHSESTNNIFNEDLEDSMKRILVPKSYFKKYDRYEYSVLTDELPTLNEPFVKSDKLVSFNPLYMFLGNRNTDVKKEYYDYEEKLKNKRKNIKN